ncbi:alpha/beta hydrolase [Phyllobacterium leguminum]|uniref:Phospholipase/carboxylesterase n=1 Tax=Phyllobacterium leguminum TaxID=314237 RepID=A0A318T9Y0_9HYPH|nr:alpha/beta hydrolase [Phyllobacterium leguminum]PYE90474.1 phospholipase/carboxylesterase [Phyllobacterium leguminum]
MINSYEAYRKEPAAGAPLVFTFHGTGGNEFQFTKLVGEILPDAGIVSPRGDVSEFGAQRFFRRTGEGVYDMDDLTLRTEKMAGFITAHKAQYPDRAVYGLGYSNGANILASVLFKHPELFDRAALMHPLIPWTPEPQAGLKGRRILITAGERDPICPLPLTQALAGYFTQQEATVELSLHSGGHEIRQNELSDLQAFLTR